MESERVLQQNLDDKSEFQRLFQIYPFTIHGIEDSLIDSFGLFALGLPDVQYHFNTLGPNEVSQHAFNVAAYLFEAEMPVNDGETIAGLLDGEMARTCTGFADSKWH